jgi:hypothetical protein
MSKFKHQVPAEHEYVHQPEVGVENWSESALFSFYDPKHGLGSYMHLARMPFDTGLWESVAALWLPGEKLLVDRAFGRKNSERGLGNATLSFECLEPHEKWVVKFDGVAHETTRNKAAANAIEDGPVVPLKIELEWETISPAWQFTHSNSTDQDWGSFHYSQAGRLRGILTYNRKSIDINCLGYRDHSMGKRDLSHILEAFWLNAMFPSGRVFFAMSLWNKGEGHDVNTGYIFDGDTMHPARVLRPAPRLDATASPYEFDLIIESDLGRNTMHVEILHAIPYSMHLPNEWILGTTHDDKDALLCVESAARYTWDDGEVGYGHREGARKIGNAGMEEVAERKKVLTMKYLVNGD